MATSCQSFLTGGLRQFQESAHGVTAQLSLLILTSRFLWQQEEFSSPHWEENDPSVFRGETLAVLQRNTLLRLAAVCTLLERLYIPNGNWDTNPISPDYPEFPGR